MNECGAPITGNIVVQVVQTTSSCELFYAIIGIALST